MTEKEQIRADMKQKRRGLDEKERDRFSRRIAEQALELDIVREARTVFIYLSYHGEVDTKDMIEALYRQGKKIFVPVVKDEKEMYPVQIGQETRWGKNRYGILEPVKGTPWNSPADLVVVPGLAFDRKRFRLGYGAGYYDRYFKEYPSVPRIGLAYDFQVLEKIPIEEHDVAMDKIVTEKRIL